MRGVNNRRRYEASGQRRVHFNESLQRRALKISHRASLRAPNDRANANPFDADLIYGRSLIEKHCNSWRIPRIGKPCIRAKMVTLSSPSPPFTPRLPPPSLIRRDFIQTTRTFCSFGDAPISREKLTADLRGVTGIGFTYLLTRHRRCRYYAPSARYFTRRSVTFSLPPSPPSLPTRIDRAYEI